MFLVNSFAYTQDLPAANFNLNADLDAVGRNPGLDFVFQQYRNQRNKNEKIKYEGSPFLDDVFKKAVVYSSNGVEGEGFVRYDGYNDEVQYKQVKEEELKILLAREDIYCQTEDSSIHYKMFLDKKGNMQKGFLFKIMETNEIILTILNHSFQRND